MLIKASRNAKREDILRSNKKFSTSSTATPTSINIKGSLKEAAKWGGKIAKMFRDSSPNFRTKRAYGKICSRAECFFGSDITKMHWHCSLKCNTKYKEQTKTLPGHMLSAHTLVDNVMHT